MSKYEPFNFLSIKSKSIQLSEKVDNLFDSVQVVIVNLMRMESYYNDQFTKVSTSIIELSQRLTTLELQSTKPIPIVPQKEVISLSTIVIPPPPPKPIQSSNLRQDIIHELEDLWKKKRLIDNEEEISEQS